MGTILLFHLGSLATLTSVSYTHLDVYKRQVTRFDIYKIQKRFFEQLIMIKVREIGPIFRKYNVTTS